jgi:hypothetical protein
MNMVFKKLVIDGIEYAPVTKSNPTAEIILRELVDVFGGRHEPEDYQLRVTCEEAPGWGEPIIEWVAKVMRAIKATEK